MFFSFFSAPRISILSDSAKHVEHRSALNLTCVVNAVASEAQSGGQKWPKMVWYKDGKVSSLIILLCCPTLLSSFLRKGFYILESNSHGKSLPFFIFSLESPGFSRKKSWFWFDLKLIFNEDGRSFQQEDLVEQSSVSRFLWGDIQSKRNCRWFVKILDFPSFGSKQGQQKVCKKSLIASKFHLVCFWQKSAVEWGEPW